MDESFHFKKPFLVALNTKWRTLCGNVVGVPKGRQFRIRVELLEHLFRTAFLAGTLYADIPLQTAEALWLAVRPTRGRRARWDKSSSTEGNRNALKAF